MDDKRSKRICDLCREAVARVLCESDEAALCWGCDAAVHSANFLVARHVRSLLCRTCLRPTAWLASGARVGPAASLCGRCLEREGQRVSVERGEVEGEGEREGENQVVPLKLAPQLTEGSSNYSTLPEDDLSCSSAARCSDSRSTEAESGIAEHEATSLSSDSSSKQSTHRKRSFARTLVNRT